jgi:hypothetical protein
MQVTRSNALLLLITGSVGCRIYHGALINVVGLTTVAAGAPTYYQRISTPFKTTTMYVEYNPRLNPGGELTHPTAAPAPSLTTEYTPRERGRPATSQPPPPTPAVPPPPPQHQQQPAQPSVQLIPVQEPTNTTEPDPPVKDFQGPDPNTLPPATAPPSHPNIDPNLIGTLDGRSILEVDLSSLNDKPWRRPGSDLSDWFNYGFDEISWEAYCYRRKELGDLATVLKANILVCHSNAIGFPQLTAPFRTLQACRRNKSLLSHLKSARSSWPVQLTT